MKLNVTIGCYPHATRLQCKTKAMYDGKPRQCDNVKPNPQSVARRVTTQTARDEKIKQEHMEEGEKRGVANILNKPFY